MVSSKIIALAMLAFASTALAHKYQVSFYRFLERDCPGNIKGAYAKNHLHEPYCKDFGNDPPFYSYGYTFDRHKDAEQIPTIHCVVSEYTERHCMGEPHNIGDASATLGNCSNVVAAKGARSAGVKCY